MSRPISRVLSWTVIHLGQLSPTASSNLPVSNAGRAKGDLFDLAPSGVYRATRCYQRRGALLPHPFTLTCAVAGHRRSALCCTFRRLTPPRNYLALCPVEPGLSSALFPGPRERGLESTATRLPGRLTRVVYHCPRRGWQLSADKPPRVGKQPSPTAVLAPLGRRPGVLHSAEHPLWMGHHQGHSAVG